MRIVLCYPAESRHIDRIAAVAGSEVVDAGQERIAAELPSADIFCGHAKVPVPWDDVVRGGRLKWIQPSAAGVDHCLVPSVVESEIVVTSLSGVLSIQVAEHAVALLTGLFRDLPAFFHQQQQKDFSRRPTRDLFGTTIGIIGFGGVGGRIAEVLAPFGVRIVATDWFPLDKPDHGVELHGADELEKVLPACDVVILAVPLTDLTCGMINERTLSLMKPGAVLVNVSRGQVVVESDLVAALESDHLSAAALDVTEEEPLPPTSRLWEMPNVIITPHVGGQSARRIDETTDFFCENLRRYLAGKPLVNQVDKRLGFAPRMS